jgi:hypothetical protein
MEMEAEMTKRIKIMQGNYLLKPLDTLGIAEIAKYRT